MKIVYTLSPNYLDSIYKEAKKYKFRIQGYTDIERAIKGLTRTNVSDILGFTYVADELPDDMSGLKKLLHLMNLVCETKPLTVFFALLDYTNFKKISVKGKTLAESYPNLKISMLPNLEDITDDIINRRIFGPILLDNYHAYYIEGISDDSEDALTREMFYVPRLEYKPIVPDKYLDIFELPELMENAERTLSFDRYYLENKDDENLEFLRRLQIQKAFGQNVNDELKSFIENLSRINNSEVFCHLSAIANYLLEGFDE